MSSADEQTEQVSKLIERLVIDPVFRAQFRADPVEVCRANGLDDLAEEFGSKGKAMHTLELRESKSSLAGVVMAVAAEGVGVVELKGMLGHGGLHGPAKAAALKALHAGGVKTPHGGAAGLARAAGVHVPSGGASGKALKSALAQASHAASGGSSASGAASASGGSGAAAADAAPGGGAASAAAPAAGGGAAASSAAPAAGGGAAASSAAPGGGGGAAARPVVAVARPRARLLPPGGGGGGAAASTAAGGGGGGGGAGAPYSATAPAGSGGAAAAATATPAGGGAGAAAGSAAPAGSAGTAGGVVEAAGSSAPGAGAGAGGVVTAGAGAAAPGGGASTAAIAQLLSSPRLAMPAAAKTLFASGTVDPRLVSVLENAVGHHTIVLGDMESVVDPVHAQAIDIVSVDGQPVGPANVGARDLITEIAALDPSMRPSEIGTPWPIQSSGFFTDPQHPNRLHLAFVSQADYQPPAAGGAAAAGAAAGGAAPGAVPGVAQVGPAPATPAAAGAAQAADAALAAPPPQPVVQQVVPHGVALSSVAPAPIAHATRGSGVDATLAYARAMIGKLPESAGNNLGPQLDKFEADFGFHGAAWCGIFAGHALEAAGLKVPHSVASVAAILELARNGDPPFVKGVLPISEARPGDLVTFGGTEHVALVTKIDSAGVHTIAGNTSQSNVSETTYSPSSVTGVARPDYAAGKPGSIPGVWDYAGVKPPAASVASAASSGPAGPAPAAAQAAAAASAAPGGGAGAGAAAHAATPAPPQPGTAEFNAIDRHAPHHRNTVQFMPAVQPAPGSPLYGQPGAAAPVAQPAPAAGGVPVVAQAADARAGAGGVLQQQGVGGAGAAESLAGKSITVSSSLLTPGQEKFAAKLSELTGLDPKVIASWALAEESGGAAQSREAASNFNWLNIGYFDSGPGKIAFDQSFSNPVSAAEQTANFLKGKWGGASSSIRDIINAAGKPPQDQLAAIIDSDWTGDSHYGGGGLLHSTFDELGNNMNVTQA